jgi:hypothetical protein
MPKINATGTYDKSKPGWEFLGQGGKRRLQFSGTTLPSTSLTVNAVDDEDNSNPLEDGTVSALPTSMIVDTDSTLEIVATGGSPDLNCSCGGITANR